MKSIDDLLRGWLRKVASEQVIDQIRHVRSGIRQMRRRTQPPIRPSDLIRDLRSAGIRAGDIVMVYSSLARVGNVEGGAETVISALKQAVTESGTLILPVFGRAAEAIARSASGDPVDLRVERSNTGKITEVFRGGTGVLRSSHAFSSFCAWGKNAEFVTSGHTLDPRVCHAQSPIGRFVDLQGKCIGLGVNLAPVTLYHLIEDAWDGFPFETSLPAVDVTYIDANGQKITRPLKRYDPEVAKTRLETDVGVWVRDFITHHMEKKGLIRRFNFGRADSWILESQPFCEELKVLASKGMTIYTTKDQWAQLSHKT